jgi:hypothetical protein
LNPNVILQKAIYIKSNHIIRPNSEASSEYQTAINKVYYEILTTS